MIIEFDLGEDEDFAQLDLDLEALESLDSEDEDSTDLDSFWDDAAEDAGKIREDSMSMEEALELGILDDLD